MRELQVMMGQPSRNDFIKLIKENGLSSCPVTINGIQAAYNIFGPDIGALKGKTTHHNPPIVEAPISKVDVTILKQYRDVTNMCGYYICKSVSCLFHGEIMDKLIEIDLDLYSPYVVEEKGCVSYMSSY